MNKLLPAFIFVVLFSFSAFAQQPPLLNNFSYTHTPGILNTCLDYTANDTGTVLVQFQLSKGDLGDVYIDQYFQAPADSSNGCFFIYGVYACIKHYVTVNLSNSHAFGPVANPLFVFNSSCAVSLDDVAPNQYSLLIQNESVTVFADEVRPNTQFALYDLQGRLLKTEKITAAKQLISLQGFSGGMYVLQVVENGISRVAERIVIR